MATKYLVEAIKRLSTLEPTRSREAADLQAVVTFLTHLSKVNLSEIRKREFLLPPDARLALATLLNTLEELKE